MRKDDEICLREAADWLRLYVSHYSGNSDERGALIKRALEILKSKGSTIEMQSEFKALHRAAQEKLH
jgi:hypothetical protein